MRKFNLYLVLSFVALLFVSCQKPEGTKVPLVENQIEYDINDTTTVFTLSTSALTSGMLLDSAVLYYESPMGVIEVVVFDSVTISKEHPKIDTLWELEPNTEYSYWMKVEDFTFAFDTITEKKSVKTIDPGLPEVSADTNYVSGGDLMLWGKVTSFWRALMNENGIGATFDIYWGTSKEEIDAKIDANVLSKKLTKDHKLELTVGGVIPSDSLQNVDTIWYQVYAKHIWGTGEKLSDAKAVPMEVPGDDE